MNISDKKIREAFKLYKDGTYENNVKTHRWAVWGLLENTDFGGSYYLLGNKNRIELWVSEAFDSRPNCGVCIISVKNDAVGYADLCHVFEAYIEK